MLSISPLSSSIRLMSGGQCTESPESDAEFKTEKERKAEAKAKGEVSSAESVELQLSEDELREVQQLAERDREVRAHERAHSSVGGAHAGAPNFSYTQGPDGVRYATSGEVSIDISPVPGNPEATIRKMQQVQSAALAPSEPSGADRSVAQKAAQLAAKARSEMFSSTSFDLNAEVPGPFSNIGKHLNEVA